MALIKLVLVHELVIHSFDLLSLSPEIHHMMNNMVYENYKRAFLLTNMILSIWVLNLISLSIKVLIWKKTSINEAKPVDSNCDETVSWTSSVTGQMTVRETINNISYPITLLFLELKWYEKLIEITKTYFKLDQQTKKSTQKGQVVYVIYLDLANLWWIINLMCKIILLIFYQVMNWVSNKST